MCKLSLDLLDRTESDGSIFMYMYLLRNSLALKAKGVFLMQ